MNSQKRQFIGVDIGGTFIKIGRFDDKGFLLAESQLLTPNPPMPGVVVMAVCEAVDKIDPSHQADYIGVGLPGPMDSKGRIARICINLPGWINVPIADWLESRLERKVALENDGNCALLGESWKGAAIGFQDVILLTLGTGVGGGVMIGGDLFKGHNGAAAEPGLIGVDPDGPICNSGNQGSLEQFASADAIKRLSGSDPLALYKMALSGDEKSLAFWDVYGRNLGIGISSLVYLFTPQLVLLGGGISLAENYFLPALCREINRRVQPVSREDLKIRTCALGNGAGRLGAALTAMKRL